MNSTIESLMIPVSEYVTVSADSTLQGVFQALDADGRDKQGQHAHRDVLVIGADGAVLGKVTMFDIYLAMEPAYKSIVDSFSESSVLTPDYLSKIFKDYNLWGESIGSLCKRAASRKVSDIMHEPVEAEYIGKDEHIDKALHRYIMGVHQPLLVRDDAGAVIGVLRYGDIFDVIKSATLACEL